MMPGGVRWFASVLKLRRLLMNAFARDIDAVFQMNLTAKLQTFGGIRKHPGSSLSEKLLLFPAIKTPRAVVIFPKPAREYDFQA